MNQPMILGNIGNRIDQQIDRIAKLRGDLAGLEKQRRSLWIAQDIDGKNVTNELDVTVARIAEIGDLLERAELGLDELHRRRAAAMTEIELVHHRQNCADLADLNQQTDRLTKQYVNAASTFSGRCRHCKRIRTNKSGWRLRSTAWRMILTCPRLLHTSRRFVCRWMLARRWICGHSCRRICWCQLRYRIDSARTKHPMRVRSRSCSGPRIGTKGSQNEIVATGKISAANHR